VAATLCLLAPGFASAADRFVATTGTDVSNNCLDAANPCATVVQAVSMSNASGDVIHIGPGTYTGAINTAHSIDFEGAGAGTTTSTAGATVINVAANAAFKLTGGGTLRNLQAVGGTSADGALELETPGTGPVRAYTVANVVAIGSSCMGCAAFKLRDTGAGAPTQLTATVTDSSFVAQGDNAGTVFTQTANADFARDSLTAEAGAIGGLLVEFGTVNFSDGSIGTPGLGGGGAEVGGGGTGNFTRSRLAGFQALYVDGGMGHATATVTDSVAVATIAGALVLNDAAVTTRGSTFVAEGTGAALGARLTASTAGDASLSSVNSIFRVHGGSAPGIDVKTVYATGHTATFTAGNSNYTTVDTSEGGTITPPGSGTNVSGDPGFVNEAGGDFRLAAGSPLIDRGADPLVAETDVRGVTRAVDGNCDGVTVPDIGAFEFVPTCPPKATAAGVPTLSKVHMTHTRFRVGKPGAARAPKGTRFVYTLSAPAKVTITIQRKTAGRKKGKRCVKPRRGLHKRCTRYVRKGALTAQSKAGQNSVGFSGKLGRHKLSPGRYRATLVAVDSAGKSKPRRLSFTIVRR
jgi:hypothetical protein